MEGGVWRTIGGRRVFIKDGQSLSDAMKKSGKFSKDKKTVENINTIEENIKKEIEKNIKLDSKDNNKNNVRVREYMEEHYPDYEYEFANDKAEGKLRNFRIKSEEEIQKAKEYVKKEEYKRSPQYKEEKYSKITNINDSKAYIKEFIEDKQTILYGAGGVYDNNNIYTKSSKEKIENLIQKSFKDYDTRVDFSRVSEATYVDIYKKGSDWEEDDKITSMRIGSHYKSGVSGNSEIALDYRNFRTISQFEDIMKQINSALYKGEKMN